ncbi:acetyltransferase [Pontiella sp.]|uniref:acetyltransferase n=1 Tax=Pontiella sp. TaxID=2837462 RepID=UPI0035642B10
MFLKDVTTDGLIEVLNLDDVFDPFKPVVHGRTQIGEDTMDESDFEKAALVFPSGEALPRCWKDSHYRTA